MSETATNIVHFQQVSLTTIVPEVLQLGGVVTFIATGVSMWPHIRHGDLVTAAPLYRGQEPRTGWVIVYMMTRDRIAVHRVIGQPTPELLKVRGDAHPNGIEYVPLQNVLGRVVLLERNGRKVDLTTCCREIEAQAIARTGHLRVTLAAGLRSLKKTVLP